MSGPNKRPTYRADSLRGRVAKFFLDNPDEELTYDLGCIKFSCSRSSLEHVVFVLREERIIETVHVIRNRSKGIAR
jgi:hypothetical protein